MQQLEFFLPRTSLSSDKILRREVLDTYFPSGLIPFEQVDRSYWKITAFEPIDYDYYVDPNLEQVLREWSPQIDIKSLGTYRSFYKNTMISFFDSWSIYFWSLIINYWKHEENPYKSINLLHVDDHQDLASPHILCDSESFTSIFNEAKIDFSDPRSIKDAILSKSIGISSFIAPLCHGEQILRLLHYKCSHSTHDEKCFFYPSYQEDHLLNPGKQRPAIEKTQHQGSNLYHLSSSISSLLQSLEEDFPIFVHIDCDAFCNRYDLNSNWNPMKASIDLGISKIKKKIEDLFHKLSKLTQPIYLNIALSPGFFPSEFWKEICRFTLILGEECGLIKEDSFSKFIQENHPKELLYEIND